MNPTGGTAKQLTDGPGVQAHSAWSPNGQMAAFSQVSSSDASISRINADGTGTVLLNKGRSWSLVPSWSPDGLRIALTSDADGNYEIYTMAADCADVKQLTFTDTPTAHIGPKYSPPDGSQILYAFPTLRGSITPAWAPDGSSIAFASNRDGNYEIYTMNPDGTGVVRLTNTPDQEASVGWSPNTTSTQ